jgi:hypothetical protein
MHHASKLALALLPVAALAAQNTTVVPSQYATVEANSSVSQPFGQTGAYRAQHIYSSSMVAIASANVTRLGLRANGGSASAAKNNVDLEIRLSSNANDPYRPSTTFSTNHGANVVTAYTRKLTNLPALAAVPGPAPFVAQFMLDNPFSYQRAQGNLIIDYLVHGQLAGGYVLDTSTSVSATITAIGTGCSGTNQTVGGGTATSDATTLTFSLSGAVPNGTSVHLLGLNQLPNPIPLPLGGCLLRQDFVFITTRPVSTSGTASLVYPLRLDYVGAEVLGQYVSADSGLTQLASTQSHRVRIGGYDPQSRVLATSVTSTTGTAIAGSAPVTQLTY